jgi:hypothetical protein
MTLSQDGSRAGLGKRALNLVTITLYWSSGERIIRKVV